MIIHGDCLVEMAKLEENSIDALVSDVPAGIAFMGKSWDHDKGGRDAWITWMTSVMREVLRVLKPGAHGLVWALPRTAHWTATALEDAGFEVRDSICHIFGSGFPKSLDVSKAIDKAAGVRGEPIGKNPAYREKQLEHDAQWETAMRPEFKYGPSTPEAKQWAGFGTALKPAHEVWWLVRKPLSEKTVAANVLKWGTGGINIDASRISTTEKEKDRIACSYRAGGKTAIKTKRLGNSVGGANNGMPGDTHAQTWETTTEQHRIKKLEYYNKASKFIADDMPVGRFPANLILTCCGEDPHDATCAVAELDRQANQNASRFFYVSKPSKREKNAGCEVNNHPCVKSTKLMSYLITMVTPPGGVVLDPFLGSGSTGVAALKSGFKFLGIEQEADYVAIAKARMAAVD